MYDQTYQHHQTLTPRENTPRHIATPLSIYSIGIEQKFVDYFTKIMKFLFFELKKSHEL